MTLWFVWLLSKNGNKEISKVFILEVTLIHPYHVEIKHCVEDGSWIGRSKEKAI
jgi:hypothetical protein